MNNRTIVHGAYAECLHIGFSTPFKHEENSIPSGYLDAAF